MFSRPALVSCIVALIAVSEHAQAGQPIAPAVFFENRGQTASGVRFVLQQGGLQAFYRTNDILFRLGDASVRLKFPGERPAVHLAALDTLPGHINFITGANPSRWATNQQIYSGVVYRGIYTGIDMFWRDRDGVAKSEFVLQPGADVDAIRESYSGFSDISVDSSGCLLLHTSQGGVVREHAPVSYTIRNGVRTPVASRYRLHPHGVVGFEVDAYDRDSGLVIDPALSYSTFLGGSSHQSAMSVAVDAAGNVYLAGWAESLNFPVTGGLRRGSGIDGFVAKFTSANTLAYCTYIGGSNEDRVTGIAVDASGNAIVAGYTASPNMPFVNAWQPALNGTRNAFIAKLNPLGTALLWGTYMGGAATDAAAAVALDAGGNIYVGGNTSSSDFPVTNGFQRRQSGQQDGFVLKLDPTGSSLLYSTFLGGSNMDTIAAIAVDSAGAAYVAGNTLSTNFPVAAPFRASIPGQQAAFVTKLSSDGRTLVYSTFLGGSSGSLQSPEIAPAIAVDSTGAAYVAGVSSSMDFPVLSSYQTLTDAGTHGFVARFNAAGSALLFSTYLGGSGRDWPNGIAVNAQGSIYVCGYTSSSDFPVLNAIQASNAGVYDAFLVRLNNSQLVYSTYLGGSSIDSADAIAIDRTNNMVVLAGHTKSRNLPRASPLQSANYGNYAAFLSKISEADIPSARTPGDFDSNGKTDLVWQNDTTGQVYVWYMGGALGNNYLGATYLASAGVSGWSLVCIADFNGDGAPDLVWQNNTTGQVYVWYMGGALGNNYLGASYLASSGMSGWSVVGAADFNGDGKPDLVWQNNSTGQVFVWYMGGALGNNYLGSTYLAVAGMTGWTVAGIADFNSDGKPDLVWQNASTHQVFVWYMGGALGNTFLGSTYLASTGMTGWSVVGVADFNGDGKPDLVWQNSTTRQVYVWYMGGALGNTFLGSTYLATSGPAGWTAKARY